MDHSLVIVSWAFIVFAHIRMEKIPNNNFFIVLIFKD
jgi:hypothetical protein